MAYPSFLEVSKSLSDCGEAVCLNPFSTSEGGKVLFRISQKTNTSQLLPGEGSLPVHLEVRVTVCENDHGQLLLLAKTHTQKGRVALAPLRVRFRVLAVSKTGIPLP